ncbi:chromatin-remodeling complex ATPase chain [Artemisia annua]|uniref:Chromatin-remodeling complex ATPase chain n=1 Tax=Artemisia annua TaxID=35608 RepID=A0A2U1PW54_ARTAN|nr:chromatin-remodeling complex ATPase chain [Artemisia annua]
MDTRSDVYVIINGCRKSSDDSDNYYYEHTPDLGYQRLLDKAKGNILGMEIIRDQSGNILRGSQSRVYNGKLVQTLLEGHSILSLEGSLSRDCDVEKNDGEVVSKLVHPRFSQSDVMDCSKSVETENGDLSEMLEEEKKEKVSSDVNGEPESVDAGPDETDVSKEPKSRDKACSPKNNLHELWALLNFLLPEIFSSAETFDEWFQISGENDQEEVVQQLHKIVLYILFALLILLSGPSTFLAQKMKSDVEKGLPPKKETILKVGMSQMQKQYYKALLQKDLEVVNAGGERKRLLNIAMQLRCPRLLKLELVGCEGSYDGIKAIGQCCQMMEAVRELVFKDCWGLDNNSFMTAIAVPVARALGYSLALSYKGIADVVQPTFALGNSLALSYIIVSTCIFSHGRKEQQTATRKA